MLLFELQQRPALNKVLPNILKLGLPLPKAAQEAPALALGLDLYWDAFQDLCTCRSGMGDGPIPWTIARDYANHLGMDEEEFEELWYLMSSMDEAWLEYQAKKREAKSG